MTNGGHLDDGQEASSHNLPELLADLTAAQSSSVDIRFGATPAPWFPISSSSRSSPALYGGQPTSASSRRASCRGNARSVSDLDIPGHSGSSFQPLTLFNTPNRSIFSSGPPTASVSASTAQASMSSPPTANSTHPLSVLTGPNTNIPRRQIIQPLESAAPIRKARFSKVEKDADDPSGTMEDAMHSNRGEMSTPTTLSRLFAAPESASPPISRHSSHMRSFSAHTSKAMSSETAPLPNHLYTRGLLSGRHSDITVNAFGTQYPLHRLLLDRAPFFCSALSEPWYESSAKEITLHPEDVDSNITKAAFELALKRIYGCHKEEEEDKEPIGLFATGCWLDLTDLIEASLGSLLKQMCPATVSTYIRLVTGNYYGKHGDRILAAAKAMLCRDGWEMPLRYFDGISGDIIREIIGSDGFYVPSEWDRWILAKRNLNRRLRAAAFEAGLVDSQSNLLAARPESINFLAVRYDTVYRKTSAIATNSASETNDQWLGVYTSPDVAPLLVLLDEGIHYVHLSFEQMQRIRDSTDVLGLPLLPEKVISNALWMSMELRQRIVNAKDVDLELGISQQIEEASQDDESPSNDRTAPFSLQEEIASHAEGKRREGAVEDKDMESGSWDGNGKPRKFWIPVADATYPLGGDLEAAGSTSAPSSRNPNPSRLSTSLEPRDVQWAADFASTPQDRPDTPCAVANAPSPQITYTHYPPFRFAAEFPPARLLKENKRVYSSTVWYAGSLWNVYVQKKETPKHTQLGIYLHRERQVEGSQELLANILHNSVDERIGHLEREILIGQGSNRRRTVDSHLYANDDSGSGNDTTHVDGPSQDLETLSGLLRNAPPAGLQKASEASLANNSHDRQFGDESLREDDEREEAYSNAKKYRVPTLPPYVDGRPTIKTYFKIYTPSRGGKILSVYESAPDRFNFSQSWGWKSSNLVLDDAMGAIDEDSRRAKDPRLRFMVVIGNV